MKIAGLIFVIAAAIAGLLVLGDSRLLGGIQFGDAVQSMIYGALAFSLVGSLVLYYRGRMSTALLGLVAWLSIFGVVTLGYSFRTELAGVANRVMDEVLQGREIRSETGQAAAVRSGNGHFAFTGITNGVELRYMFDTGASTVVLRYEDARRIGLNPDKMDYSVAVSTANGKAVTAPASIDALTIGNITQRRVRVLIDKPGALQENLLGMSFLGRLKGYAVDGNRLVLRE